MKKTILIIALIFTSSILVTSCKNEKKETSKEEVVTEKVAYQCPMKCEEEKTYDKMGDCPVCKMKLREKVSETDEHDHENH